MISNKLKNMNTSHITLSSKQKECIEKYNDDNKHLFLDGSPGTGKTLLAIMASMIDIFNKNRNQLILIRSIVPTRDLGFLPGEIKDKVNPYFEFYESLFYEAYDFLSSTELIPKGSSLKFFLDECVVFENTSFLRGKTFDNSVIFLDEYQNLNKKEIHTVMTRVGNNSKVIIAGDLYQSDLKGKEVSDFLKRVCIQMSSFYMKEFDSNDIVRSGFVKEWCLLAEPLIFIGE